VSRPLRVALVCPYSLSVDGGVQLQVLGLARALRALGVDARVLAPSDGPPPETGIVTLGPTRGFPSNGSIAPISASKVVAGRTLEALRSFRPDVVHLHEPLSPGANYAALLGTDIPAVGTFHAAHPGRNGWYDAFRLPLRKVIDRLTVRTAVSAEAGLSHGNRTRARRRPCDQLLAGLRRRLRHPPARFRLSIVGIFVGAILPQPGNHRQGKRAEPADRPDPPAFGDPCARTREYRIA
jgi:hypothetical protein